MIINGQKWSCETCIKGHRASHCQHKDRPLTLIKKKGRPSTQFVKKKPRSQTLRPIAPKNKLNTTNNDQLPITVTATKSSCCKKNNDSPLSLTLSSPPSSSPFSSFPSLDINTPSSPLLLLTESVPLPNIPPPTSCCGPPAKNQQGETIRVVTCRCGDDCACIGCDAHPSRAMKEGKKDVYIGFATTKPQKPRVSLEASFCSVNNMPSSILSEDGTMLCGCGCLKTLEDCSCCFHDLC
ncbi:MAG: copper fist DNA binding domain-containing protein [Benjaminiella poitrasii]|nr:MAG: copper fist DNA binding domain-containing protein [Benjaminiella poitrasii]